MKQHFFFGFISEAGIVIEPLLPDLKPLLDFERNTSGTKKQVLLERLYSGKYALVSSTLNEFRMIIYVNNQLWMDDPVVLEDGDVIEISHFRDCVFQFNPLLILEGSLYFSSSVCSKNSKRKLLNWLNWSIS